MSISSTSARASPGRGDEGVDDGVLVGLAGNRAERPVGRFVGATTGQPSASGRSTPRLRGWRRAAPPGMGQAEQDLALGTGDRPRARCAPPG